MIYLKPCGTTPPTYRQIFISRKLGLYAQNVYVNQRHLAFSLGIMILVMIAVYPMFRSMIGSLKRLSKDKG